MHSADTQRDFLDEHTDWKWQMPLFWYVTSMAYIATELTQTSCHIAFQQLVCRCPIKMAGWIFCTFNLMNLGFEKNICRDVYYPKWKSTQWICKLFSVIMNQFIQTFSDHESVYPDFPWSWSSISWSWISISRLSFTDHEPVYPDFLSLIMNQYIQTFFHWSWTNISRHSLIMKQFIQTLTDHEPIYPLSSHDHELIYPDFRWSWTSISKLPLIMIQYIQTFADHEQVYPDFHWSWTS